jgi:peptide/nickel transport system substrate-binding protein
LIPFLIVGSIAFTTACAPGPAGPTGSAQDLSRIQTPQRTLNFPVFREVTNLYPPMNGAGGTAATLRMFNGGFTVTDDQGNVHPELAELPELNTDTWRVLPDGQMRTTHRLKTGLTWHDGRPLAAEDFVFAKRVNANGNSGARGSPAERLMDQVEAPDAATVVITWRSAYAGANRLAIADFVPLPRHILEQPFTELEQNPGEAEAFRNLPYWKAEYVGTGPFRLVHWEPGVSFEGEAFAGFARGRPQIERVSHRVMADDAIMTELLAGTLDMGQLNFEHYALLTDWVRTGKGSLILAPGNIQPNWIQLKPEYVGHAALLDVRVRRALAHSLDRQAINEGVFDGQGIMIETLVPPSASLFPEVERTIFRYPYDPRISEQLMGEAGFTKDRDTFFADASGARFVLDFERNMESDRERMQLIMMDTWQRAGFEVRPAVIPAGASQEHRATFPGLQGTGSVTESSFHSGQIATAQNRWSGSNNGGFSNAEYDRLFDAFHATLDPTERTRHFIEMQRVFTEHLPMFITHFALNTWAVGAHLDGVKSEAKAIGDLTPGTERYFNIHEWHWK